MLDPLAPLRIVIVDPSVADPALDSEAMAKIKNDAGESQLQRYVATRDPSLVMAKTGQTPAWWTLEPISGLYLSLVIDAQATESQRRALAFMASCRSIQFGDGKTLEPAKLIQQKYGQEMVEDEFFEVVRRKFGVSSIYEAGHVAIQRAQLSEDARGVFRWSRI